MKAEDIQVGEVYCIPFGPAVYQVMRINNGMVQFCQIGKNGRFPEIDVDSFAECMECVVPTTQHIPSEVPSYHPKAKYQYDSTLSIVGVGHGGMPESVRRVAKDVHLWRIYIRRNADGVIHYRDQLYSLAPSEDRDSEQCKQGHVFWWSSGNMSCDCNRGDEFYSIENGGEAPGRSNIGCTDEQFSVKIVDIETGEVVMDWEHKDCGYTAR